MSHQHISELATLLVSCRDQAGIVAGLSDLVFRHHGNIVDLQQYTDEETGEFFMRLQVDLSQFTLDRQGIDAALTVPVSIFNSTGTSTNSLNHNESPSLLAARTLLV